MISQHPHGSSQLCLTSDLGDLIPPVGHTYRQHGNIYEVKVNKFEKDLNIMGIYKMP